MLLSFMIVCEFCVNCGYMVVLLCEYFGMVEVVDIYDYGVGFLVWDYLFGLLLQVVYWMFMNLLFWLVEQFIQCVLVILWYGVVVIVRLVFFEGVGCWCGFFSVFLFSDIL